MLTRDYDDLGGTSVSWVVSELISSGVFWTSCFGGCGGGGGGGGSGVRWCVGCGYRDATSRSYPNII
jgi:hypothetical protein